MSAREIGDHVGVSHNFVAVLKKQLSSDDSSPAESAPPKVTGKDGKQYLASRAEITSRLP